MSHNPVGKNPRKRTKRYDVHLDDDTSPGEGPSTPIQTVQKWRHYHPNFKKFTNHNVPLGWDTSSRDVETIPIQSVKGSRYYSPETPNHQGMVLFRRHIEANASQYFAVDNVGPNNTMASFRDHRKTSRLALREPAKPEATKQVSLFAKDASDNTNAVLSYSPQHNEMKNHFPGRSARHSALGAAVTNGPPSDSPSDSCCDIAHFSQSSESPLRKFSFDRPFPLAKNTGSSMANKKTPKVAAGVVPPTLPPSVEEAYRKKCVELRRRMAEVEQSNDSFRLRKNRLLRGIRKIRLERTILLDLLGKRMRKNGDDGYYDDDSEDSSEIPATPNDKPLRNKRSHRRTVISSPPMLAQQVSSSIGAPHQHHRSALAPYQSHHEISFSTVQTPNGLSHLQSHPSSHPELYSTHNLLPSADSQIHYPASAFEYFLDDQFYQSAQGQNFRSEEEMIEAAHAAWSKLTTDQIDTFVQHWTHNLTRWRQAMEEEAMRTGEPPRGQLAAGSGARLESARRDSDLAQRDREAERQRDMEMENQTNNEDSKRVGSSGFTSIN